MKYKKIISTILYQLYTTHFRSSSSSLIVKLISAHTIKSGKERGGKEKKREKVFFSVPLIIMEYIYTVLLSFYFSLFKIIWSLEKFKFKVILMRQNGIFSISRQ